MANKLALSVSLAVAAAGIALAHPHFNKTLVVQLPGSVEARVAYRTIPCNELQLDRVAVGAFATPRAPRLTTSAPLRAGAVSLPAGEYTIGVVRVAADDWVMALYPGRMREDQSPEPTRLIRLPSRFTHTADAVEHTAIELSPGEGLFKGKAVVTLRFGSRRLEGALDYPAGDVPAPDRTPGAIHGHP